jgi:uncharacterized protein YjbI with pentapeptide repeats
LNGIQAGVPLKEREISGDVDSPDVSFEELVQFLNCDLIGINFAGCRFAKGLKFIGCVFTGEVSLESARVDGDCHFRACTFEKEARFDRLQVNGKLEMRAPRDRSPLSGNRHAFESAPYVTFKENANFSQIRVSGEANFGSVQFWESVDFYNARIEGPVFFRKDYCKLYQKDPSSPLGFPDKDFPVVHFGERLEDQPATNADRIKTVRFRDCYFASELNFHGAIFNGDADFTYLHCGGMAFFCYEKPEETKSICIFRKRVNFEGARLATSLHLDKAAFCGAQPANFRDCRIAENLVFSETIPGQICLTGCSYRRIQCTSYKLLIASVRAFETSGKKFDPASWIQLEATLRKDGDLKLADEVYWIRMQQREALAVLSRSQASLSRLWYFISAYGTSQWQLVMVCLAMFMLGVPCYYYGQLGPAPPSTVCHKGFWEAVALSLSQFSPFKLPVGEECKPLGLTAVFATFEKLIGWLLVPLLVANVTGLLHRKAKSGAESGSGEE